MSTQENVIKVLGETLGVHEKEISLEARVEDLVCDSIKLFELITVLEEEFEKEVDYASLVEIETVGDIVRYIEGHS